MAISHRIPVLGLALAMLSLEAAASGAWAATPPLRR